MNGMDRRSSRRGLSARRSMLRSGRDVAVRQALLSFSGVILVAALAGCSAVSQAPSFESTKAEALAFRQELAQTLPSDGLSTATEKDNLITCDGGDTAQYDGTMTVTVPDDFDRAAWLDEAAATFAERSGWRVEKRVDADGSSDATSGVAFFSEGGYYMRLDEFDDGQGGGPVIILSASGPCSAL